jgi:hypothetical protein
VNLHAKSRLDTYKNRWMYKKLKHLNEYIYLWSTRPFLGKKVAAGRLDRCIVLLNSERGKERFVHRTACMITSLYERAGPRPSTVRTNDV